jgi:nucleoid-associated protein YgaU
MRKDVRLGLGVGGILFGVVLVYVLFFAGGKGDDQFAIDGGSDSAAATGGGGNAADSTAANGSVRPYETGQTLVQTGPISTVTPQQPTTGTPTAGANATGNATSPHGSRALNGFAPTTRPTAPFANNFAPPTATATTWNWRELVDHGARDGQLLSFTETPTPGGGRPLIEQHRINLDPPTLGPATGDTRAEEPSMQNATGPRVYIVKPGDSFWSIARAEYGNASYYNHLVRANPKVDPARLKAGMRITIPGRDEVIPKNAPPTSLTPTPVAIDETRQYRVKKGDNLSTIASRLYGRAEMAQKLYELNRDVIGPNPSALKLNTILALPEAPTRFAGTSAAN